MDPQRMKEAYERLQLLDERLGYHLRARGGGPMYRPGTEQLEEKLRHLTEYTVELKDILQDLFLALAARPKQGS